MANPYEQAANIAAPFAQLGSQMFQGANMREAGYQKQMLQNAQQGAFQGHANLYNAQAQKAAEEASGMAQHRQYQTPEFSSQAAATALGIAPEIASLIQSGGNHGLTPETVQRYNMLRGAGMMGLNATQDGNSSTTMDTFIKLLGSSATPQQAAVLGQGMAASQGKPIYHQGSNGTMNSFTGVENLNAVGKSSANAHNASAANSYASADQHRASAASTRAKMNQPTTNPDGSVTAPAKPMPAAALKMQQEGLENLSIASNINPMMQRFADDIDSNKLRLGPVANLMNRGKNFAGSSDEGSRNFASFQATLEKLRNDSLRLNKGVQTDGDAQRAWNELMSNINDPGVVKQRIKEIQGINERAVELHRMQVNQVRRNFGHPDIDISGYVAPKAGGSNIDALLNKYGN